MHKTKKNGKQDFRLILLDCITDGPSHSIWKEKVIACIVF